MKSTPFLLFFVLLMLSDHAWADSNPSEWVGTYVASNCTTQKAYSDKSTDASIDDSTPTQELTGWNGAQLTIAYPGDSLAVSENQGWFTFTFANLDGDPVEGEKSGADVGLPDAGTKDSSHRTEKGLEGESVLSFGPNHVFTTTASLEVTGRGLQYSIREKYFCRSGSFRESSDDIHSCLLTKVR